MEHVLETVKSILCVAGILFPKGECLNTHRVDPLSLSGSFFLGLLVFDFYPPTNRDLYMVVVVLVVVGRIFGSIFEFFQSCLEVV